MGRYQDLIVYQKSFALALAIQSISNQFPTDERYALTDQIKRSSRSVCANIAEAYARRRSIKYFISKLNDAQCENGETFVWIEFAHSFGYIKEHEHADLSKLNGEIGRLLYFMISHPNKFLP